MTFEIEKPKRPISYAIIHCADTPPGMDVGVKEIRQWHTMPAPKGRGWTDIGYHFVVRRNGQIEKGRDIIFVGAHCAGFNSDSVGICLVGGYKGICDFEDVQFQSLIEILVKLKNIYANIEILGHRDLNPGKECPSFSVGEWLKNVGLNKVVN